MTTDDSLYKSEHTPNEAELKSVGAIGILLFFSVISYAIYGLTRKSGGIENNKIFFCCMICIGVFELPRYFSMASYGSYTSTGCYAIHLFASFLYFVCLTIVALTFAQILELGRYSSLIYSKKGILILVSIQAIIDFGAFIACLSSKSLGIFFSSKMYIALTVVDVFENFLFSFLLSFYGIKLILRFNNLQQYASTSKQRDAFRLVLKKVTKILCTVTIFSAIRLSLLVVKLASLGDNGITVTSPGFSLYGFLWFVFSDFLPRGASSICLIYLMQSDRVATNPKQPIKTSRKKPIVVNIVEMNLNPMIAATISPDNDNQKNYIQVDHHTLNHCTSNVSPNVSATDPNDEDVEEDIESYSSGAHVSLSLNIGTGNLVRYPSAGSNSEYFYSTNEFDEAAEQQYESEGFRSFYDISQEYEAYESISNPVHDNDNKEGGL